MTVSSEPFGLSDKDSAPMAAPRSSLHETIESLSQSDELYERLPHWVKLERWKGNRGGELGSISDDIAEKRGRCRFDTSRPCRQKPSCG